MTRSAALALVGLLVAIALYPLWDRPAPEGQLPGLATKLDFDAHGPFRWIAGLIVLPLLVPLLFGRKKAAALPPQSKRSAHPRTFLLIPLSLATFLITIELFPKLDLGHCILIALAAAFALARIRIHRRALAFVLYPLALYAYAHATSLITAEGAPRVSMFEDSHSLMPASEYLRGERPYRDILPGHGLLEDGLFDYLALHVVKPEIGSTLRARFVVGSLTSIAIYALVLAACGSGEVAMLAVLFGLSAGMLTPSIRVLPALIALAFLMRFARTRNPRWLIGAGFFNVVQGATSIDFAFFTLVTIVVAVIRQRRGWKHAAIGIAAGVIPLFAAFALSGILGAFFRGTFVEVLSLGPVYTLGMFAKPQHWRDTALHALWCLAALFAGATIARRPLRRTEPLFLIAIWMMLGAISYAERQHLYWNWLAPAFVAGGTWLLVQRRHALAPLTVAAAIVLAAPMTHLTIVHTFRHAEGSLDARWRPVANVPRARGALFHEYDRKVIASVARYLPTLAADETFLDFTNRGLLYFLFDRDCPIRYYEVAYYETEERQRAVIAALEANPKIRAVLVPGPIGAYPVDGIRNRDRAPLVWAYIERHFRPDFAEGDVVFWRR